MNDGLMMRILADSPGGLELHIGVSFTLMLALHCLLVCGWPSGLCPARAGPELAFPAVAEGPHTLCQCWFAFPVPFTL